MDFLQLKYFQTVARLEHMTKAAEQLHIAQPSLSSTISRLENSIGVSLFDRQGRKIKLNKYGEVLLKHVDRIFYQVEEASRELADMAGLEKGTVRLGTSMTRLLPHFIKTFIELHPEVNVQLLQINSSNITSFLEEGTIDFAITSPLKNQQNIDFMPLLNEEVYLAVSKHHRLADRSFIDLTEVKDEKFICLTADYSFTENTFDFFHKAGFSPNIAFECNDAEAILQMVNLELGVALAPAHWWNEYQLQPPKKIRLNNFKSERTIGIAWRDGHYLSSAALTLRSFAADYFANRSF